MNEGLKQILDIIVQANELDSPVIKENLTEKIVYRYLSLPLLQNQNNDRYINLRMVSYIHVTNNGGFLVV